MPRTLSGTVSTLIDAVEIHVALACHIETAVGDIRCWTGVSSLSWNSQTWEGVGQFGDVSPISESTDLASEGIVLTLSGIPASLITAATDELAQGRDAELYLLFMADTGAVVDSVLLYAGRVDRVEVVEGGETSTIRVAVENELIDLKRARVRRYTDADQKQEYSGDRGFEFVAAMQELKLNWGGESVSPVIPGGGGGDSGSGGKDFGLVSP